MARCPPPARPLTGPIGSYEDGEKILAEMKPRTTTVVFPGILTNYVDAHLWSPYEN